jgi:MoaA/NifB/PqqE/SkfB family radical SAM enzyme
MEERGTEMKEWSDQYNPFNSIKALMWREQLEGCAKRDFLPPVTIYVDPTGRCSLNCVWCHSAEYNESHNTIIPKDNLFAIAKFAKEWCVKSIHVFGGGEPLMHPDLGAFLIYANSLGLEVGLITNGVLLDGKMAATIVSTCRWIGISVDAGTPKTYMKVKGTKDAGLFDKVLGNIERLCWYRNNFKSTCSICAKFLLHPLNAKEIYKCASIVRGLGVNDFQIRPAAWENTTNSKLTPFDFEGLIPSIDKQIKKALSLETESFHVYGIRHKFSPQMGKTRNYARCWASPLALLFGVDGKCYICGDHRGQKEFALCDYIPNIENVLKCWNSKKHHKILDLVNLDKCPRCVVGPYHEMVEKVFIKDQMCRMFP